MASLRTYSLSELLYLVTGQAITENSFHLGYFTGQDRVIPYPYRVQGYAIGVTVSGSLEGSLNLDSFQVKSGQLMIIAPGQIHRILSCSADFAMRTLFFTDAFLTNVSRDSNQVATLGFFQPTAPAVMSLTWEEWQRLTALINVIEQHYLPINQATQLPISYLVQAILTDLNQVYQTCSVNKPEVSPKNRPAELANRFRQLVSQQYLTRRQVSDYADQLAVSAKHLSETVKTQTGKPASYWVDAMVVQEAQVLLSQTSHTLSQIADYLQFSTQSAFGKFFRQKLGISPKDYRNKP